jgi:hypothetical protein
MVRTSISGASVSAEAEDRELEAGERTPTFEIWDRICRVFGWPKRFAS